MAGSTSSSPTRSRATRPTPCSSAREGGWRLDLAHPLAAVTGVRAALWGDLDNDGRTDVVLVRGTARIGGVASDGAERVARRHRQQPRGHAAPRRHRRRARGRRPRRRPRHLADERRWPERAAEQQRQRHVPPHRRDGRRRPATAGARWASPSSTSTTIATTTWSCSTPRRRTTCSSTTACGPIAAPRALPTFAAAAFGAVVGADLDANGQAELYTTGPRGLERWTPDAAGVWRPFTLAAAAGRAARAWPWPTPTATARSSSLATQGGGWAAFDVRAGTARSHGRGGLRRRRGRARLDRGHARRRAGSVGDRRRRGAAWWHGRPDRAATPTPRSPSRAATARATSCGRTCRAWARAWPCAWARAGRPSTRPAATSGPGQSLQPTAVGLGGAPQADFVSLVWPDGVLQTEMALGRRPAARHRRNAAPALELPRAVCVQRHVDGVRHRHPRRRRHRLLRAARRLQRAVPARARAVPRGQHRAPRRPLRPRDRRADGGGDLSGSRLARRLRPAAGLADGARRAQGDCRADAHERPALLSRGAPPGARHQRPRRGRDGARGRRRPQRRAARRAPIRASSA